MQLIQEVTVHPDYPDVIRVRMIDGSDLHYYRTDKGIMVLGFPYIMYDKASNTSVSVFVPMPMGQTNLPYLMSVKSHE